MTECNSSNVRIRTETESLPSFYIVISYFIRGYVGGLLLIWTVSNVDETVCVWILEMENKADFECYDQCTALIIPSSKLIHQANWNWKPCSDNCFDYKNYPRQESV